MRKTLLILACLFLAASPRAHGGSFMDLEPGTSKKSDTDRVLGVSGRPIRGGDWFEYKPDDPDIERISIKVNHITKVIEQIDIHPGTGKLYYKSHYKKWFDLGEPSKTAFDYYPGDPKVHKVLVEYYVKEGIALHYDDEHDGSYVMYFSHFDPKILDTTIDNKIPQRDKPKNEAHYLKKAQEARKKKDWETLGRIVEEGLRSYPNSPQLWNERSSYFFHTASVSREVKSEETLRSAKRAYELDPKTLHALNLGWIYLEMFKDYFMALPYFEEVEREYGPKNPDLYYWMARCYEETGNINKAVNYYQRFLDVKVGSEHNQDARSRLTILLQKQKTNDYGETIPTEDTPCGQIQLDRLTVPEDFKIVFAKGPTHAERGPREFTALYADGRYAVWLVHPGQSGGPQNAAKEVIKKATISPDKVKSMYAQVMACDFFSMESLYENPKIIDGENSEIVVWANGKSHRVQVYFYDVKRFESIKKALIDQVSPVSGQIQNQTDYSSKENAIPEIIFEDSFDGENRGKGVLNYSAFLQWEVVDGTVDLIGNGFHDYYPGHGLYIDLDGSTLKAGTLVSKIAFRLKPGKYNIQFDLAGNPLSGPNRVTVELGSVYREDFSLGIGESFGTVLKNISVSSSIRAKLSFRHFGGDNHGLLLDNIKIIKIPHSQIPPKKFPSPQKAKNESYYIEKSDIALEKKDWNRAIQFIEEGLRKFPNSADLWHSRASYYFKNNNEPKRIRDREATRSMERAYELNPSASYTAELGWFYQTIQGDCDAALASYEEAEKKGYAREHKRLLYWMAWCYEKKGYYALSKKYYRHFLDLAPEDEKAKDAWNRLRRLGAQ